MWSDRSSGNLQGVDPRLLQVMERAREISGVPFEVSEGRRDAERQRKLVAQGKSQTMNSRHLHGNAVDIFIPKGDGGVNWDFEAYRPIAAAAKQAAKEFGYNDFVWGGDWKTLKDGVHFQIGSAGSSPQTTATPSRSPQAPANTQGAAPMMQQQEEKPRGLLGSLGIQKMEEGAAGETGQRFYQRDSFKDTAAILAQGFGRMGVMGMEEIADNIAKQRTENKARNKTMEMLSKLPNGEHLMRVADIAGPKAAVDLYISEQRGGGVGGVQSSSALPDQSGVVLTLRDGSIQVKTAGGETLSGQAAMDFVRAAQESAAKLERGTYRARREGTNLAEADTGAAAAAARKSGELTMDRGFKAYDDAVTAGSALTTMDEAIAALDNGAKSGLVYNMLPSVTEASASLSNAMNRMGLDVISSVTFGALSAPEMNLAMETAVPRGLAPAELRSWLVKKRDAQAKAREALMNAARYLTQPGNTLSGWLEQQDSASAPAATAPAPSSGGITDDDLKYLGVTTR